MVLTALKRIGLPALSVHTQPTPTTLVNLDTIFYTDPVPFTRQITLLGQPVSVTARPTSYRWDHGDGTSAISSTPGAPYPSMQVTHTYLHAHVTVHPRVSVTYAGRFKVADGPWQDIPGSVTITGPPTDLRVAEATPVLSGNR